jgi:hypothetical protein
MKRLILLDQTTQSDIGGERTKQQKANFKTGALNHSATLPALIQIEASFPSANAISAKLSNFASNALLASRGAAIRAANAVKAQRGAWANGIA